MAIDETKVSLVDDKERAQTYITPKGMRHFAEIMETDIPEDLKALA